MKTTTKANMIKIMTNQLDDYYYMMKICEDSNQEDSFKAYRSQWLDLMSLMDSMGIDTIISNKVADRLALKQIYI